MEGLLDYEQAKVLVCDCFRELGAQRSEEDVGLEFSSAWDQMRGERYEFKADKAELIWLIDDVGQSR